jgi:hypothetical protein
MSGHGYPGEIEAPALRDEYSESHGRSLLRGIARRSRDGEGASAAAGASAAGLLPVFPAAAPGTAAPALTSHVISL